MGRKYHLDSVLLPQGWVRDAWITVTDDGYISAIDTAIHADAGRVERIAGIVVPGMPNAHSHAFQRGMAGNTEYRLSARDSFWTWRQVVMINKAFLKNC